MLTCTIAFVAAAVLGPFPSDLAVHHVERARVGCWRIKTALSPTMLGDRPDFVIDDRKLIDSIYTELTRVSTDRDIDPAFVFVVLWSGDAVVYIDESGVVQMPQGRYLIDPAKLEALLSIEKKGTNRQWESVPIPPEWDRRIPATSRQKHFGTLASPAQLPDAAVGATRHR